MNMVEFSELFIFEKKSKRKSGDGLSNGKYPFYSSSSKISKFTNEPDYSLDSALIIGTGGSASIHYAEGDFSTSGDCFTVTKNPKIELYTKFAYYYIAGNMYLLDEGFKGAGLKHISKAYIQDIKIPLPPLADQQKIVAILDAADSLRQKDQQMAEHYTALSQSLFLKMFGDPVTNPMGWKKIKLGDLTDLVTDGKHGDCQNETSSGYFFISAKDINNQIIDYSNARQINKHDFNEVHRRTNLCRGDLVMVNTGATIGKIAVATDPEKTERTTFQKSVAVIKPKKNLLSTIFLKYLFLLRIDAFASKGSGSAVKNLLLSEMRRFEIIVPELKFQNQFSERIQLIEAQKQQAQRSLEKSEALFNSLLQRAFTGELTAKMAA